ncbi:MAG: hypothetical protein WC384_13300 [Prolixibacteraceae bacterium]|jgi:hypothetical protein
MKTDELLHQILPILHSVKDDEEKLQQILDFLLEEIYEEPDDEEIVIPEKYRKLVHDIAESIDCGMVCFVNPETFEMEDVPKTLLDEGFVFDEEEDEVEEKEDTMFLEHLKWEKCITVEQPESRESFRIMEGFVSEVDDKKLQKQLINALGNRHPFANFKNIIDGSQYRKEWFAFKQQKLEEVVWNELSWQLEKDAE